MTGPTMSSTSSSSGQVSPKSQLETSEKYKLLKRRFHEVAEETGQAANRSEERNVRKREEQDHIRAEMQEIEQQLGVSSNGSVTTDSTKSEDGAQNGQADGRKEENGHTLESLSNAATSPLARAAVTPNAISHSVADTVSQSSSPTRHAGTSVDGSRTSPRSSQRIATRRSQRNSGGSGSAIAAVAAAAAQAEAAEASSTSVSKQQDVDMGDATTPQQNSSTSPSLSYMSATSVAPLRAPSFTPVEAAPVSGYANFAQAASMESIVRVAEAAVAAQNAAKLASSRAQPNSNANPNLDPSLFGESSNSSSPTISQNASSATSGSDSAADSTTKQPTVDTSTGNSTSAGGPSAATPTSTTSTSSNLSNNPYLALATNYQRTPSAATPTGHPMLLPYPLFYPPPGTHVPTGTPAAYPMAYNPYYYLTAPIPGANGMYAPHPGFPPPFPPQQPQQLQQPKSQNGSDQRAVKPKRLKSHTVTTKSFSIPMVPRDKQAKPMLPLNVGIMTVINLGTVCMREHFHTERYIFPVGYEVTRRYLSTVDPSLEVVYHCTILDGGDGPKFQIIPSDRPDKPVIAGTATGAWSNIVKQANAIRNRQHSNSVSGPDFFGLGQNTIKHLIQELPSADKLRDYVWQNFVEGGPLGGRHAAVIPALPEEYDASMPIGAFYPSRDNNAGQNHQQSRGLSYYPQHIIAQAEAQRASQAGQDGAVAGPSGFGGSISAPVPSTSILNGQPTAVAAMPSGSMGDGSRLVIQEYQPPQQEQNQPQSISAPAGPLQEPQTTTPKRVTRSTAAAANATAGPSSNTRHTRSVSKGQQQQQQHEAPASEGAAPAAPSTINGDAATTHMTFAGIMKAYPAPTATATPQTTAPPNTAAS